MKASRRNFLAAGLAVPAAGLAGTSSTSTAFPGLEARPADPAPAGLSYRMLGKTGMKVTSVGFGCMITSDQSVIEKGADSGINYFDTARIYQGGNNERLVGAALKNRRKNLFISTKTEANDKQGALNELDTSLKTLGFDYVDVWYLHGKGTPAEISDDLLEAQAIAKKQGKIRFAGVSTHTAAAVVDRMIQVKSDVMLTSYNFTMDQAATEAVAKAKKAGIGVVAMKVMAGGKRKMRAGDRLSQVWARGGAQLACLKWVLKNPEVDTTIPGITDMEQLDDNLKAMTAKFTDADAKLLAGYLEYIRPMYCRMCNQCAGVCPKGLPVADVLRFLMYADDYGQFPLGRERFMELPEHIAAVRCSDCESCPIKCPNGVRVTERLVRAQGLFA
jgi:uncharacterized protein